MPGATRGVSAENQATGHTKSIWCQWSLSVANAFSLHHPADCIRAMRIDSETNYRLALDPFRCKGTGCNGRTAAKRLELRINDSTLFVHFYLKDKQTACIHKLPSQFSQPFSGWTCLAGSPSVFWKGRTFGMSRVFFMIWTLDAFFCHPNTSVKASLSKLTHWPHHFSSMSKLR